MSSKKDKPQVTVSTTSGGLWLSGPRRVLAIVVLCMVLVGGTSWYLIAHHNSNKSKDATNAAVQRTLQTTLQTALNGAGDPSTVIDATSQLIKGVNNTSFHMKTADVAQLYLQRATAYMNLKQYKNAISDYDAASKLDDKNKAAALQGEIEARYRLGDRAQLIPLYQQLIALTQKQTDNPLASSFIAQYQASITSLQKGQGLPAYDN